MDFSSSPSPPGQEAGFLRWVTACLFSHMVAVAILGQVWPRSILDALSGDDARASAFLAELSLMASIAEFAVVPRLSELSDVRGRKPLLRVLDPLGTDGVGKGPNRGLRWRNNYDLRGRRLAANGTKAGF